MKVNRNGQAEILSRDRLGDLFNVMPDRYRLLFGICYFTGCRIAEAIQLKKEDVGDRAFLLPFRPIPLPRGFFGSLL